MKLGMIAVTILVVGLLALAGPAGAAIYYWDIDGNVAGAGGGTTPNGTWNSSNLVWSTSSLGTAAVTAHTTTISDDLYFSAGTTASGAWTCTVSGTQYGNSLTVEEGTVTLSGNSENARVGTAYVNSGATLKITGADSVLGKTCLLSMNGGTFNLNNQHQEVAGLTGSSGTVLDSSGNFKELTINVASGASQSYGGAITGQTYVSKRGAGTQTLTSANTYSGTTRIVAGALGVGNSLVGLSANTKLSFYGGAGDGAGGVLEGNGTFSWALGTGTGQVQWKEGGNHDGGFSAQGNKLTVNIGGSGTPSTLQWSTTSNFVDQNNLLMFGSQTADNEVDFRNPIDIGGNNSYRGFIWVTDNTGSTTDFATLSGVLSNGRITKVGDGTLVLSGTNTYTDTTNVKTGNLVAGANAPSSGNGAFGNSSGGAIAVGISGTASGANLGLLINGAYTVGRAVTVGNYGNVVTLGGTNTSGIATFSGATTLSKAVTLKAAGGGTVDFSGNISGGFAVTKDGDGTVTFSTAKSYTGATTIKAGMILVNSTLASSGVTVQTGGTLGGSGTIAGATTVDLGGKLSPGASIGTLTFSNGLTINGELDAGVSGSTSSDLLVITGDLTLGGASILDIQGTLPGSDPTAKYTLATYTGTRGITQFNTVKYNGTTDALPAGWSVQYDDAHKQVLLLPEPATMALLALGGVGLLARRRSRKS